MKRRAAGTAGGIAAAVPAALLVALAGTMLHGQHVLLAGVRVPWGAAAALALLGAVELWLGAAFRSVLPTGVCGAVCYALAGWWSSLASGRRLIVGNLAGSLWIYGIAAVTLVLLVWCRRYRPGSAATAAGSTGRRVPVVGDHQ